MNKERRNWYKLSNAFIHFVRFIDKQITLWTIGTRKQQCNIHDVSKNEVAGCDYCRDEQGFTIGNMYVCDKCGRQVP